MMKKILISILIFSFLAQSADASLLFAGASGNDVTFASNSSINDFSSFTFWAWIKPDSYTSNRYIFAKGNVSKRMRVISPAGNGQLEFAVDRATDCSRDAAAGTFTTNTWTFVAGVYEESTNTCQIFVGTLNSPVVEASYSAGTAGSGTTGSDAANDFIVGNQTSASTVRSFGGSIAAFGYINRALSANELRNIQYQPRVVSGTKIFAVLGFSGLSSQVDWSGNRNTGTINSIEGRSPNVPLRFFGR